MSAETNNSVSAKRSYAYRDTQQRSRYQSTEQNMKIVQRTAQFLQIMTDEAAAQARFEAKPGPDESDSLACRPANNRRQA
jgi:hypothetical protein